VAYLSFQSGEGAKAVDQTFLLDMLGSGLSRQTMDESGLYLIYLMRQMGRVLAFFVVGALGTVTVQVSFRGHAFWKSVLSTGFLLAFAYLTEKLKIYIPDRHYSREEMLMSIAAAFAGILFVSFLMLCFHIFKSIFRRLGKVIQN
jgi:hypothetical protein